MRTNLIKTIKIMYKIGIYKNGKQIAKEVYSSNNLDEIKTEFKNIFESTIEDCWEDSIEFGWELETLDDVTFEQAWEHKHFSEDTNNVAVFSVNEGEALHTNYTYVGCTSNIL